MEVLLTQDNDDLDGSVAAKTVSMAELTSWLHQVWGKKWLDVLQSSSVPSKDDRKTNGVNSAASLSSCVPCLSLSLGADLLHIESGLAKHLVLFEAVGVDSSKLRIVWRSADSRDPAQVLPCPNLDRIAQFMAVVELRNEMRSSSWVRKQCGKSQQTNGVKNGGKPEEQRMSSAIWGFSTAYEEFVKERLMPVLWSGT
ncbi:hypothetical protein B0H19DRAFT_1072519 [Mycena capillaripes]|nr:hypothetical protein B0H19DRAFT_1072519 [Mycena capillaripes]